MTEDELKEYFEKFPYPIQYKIKPLGDRVDDISTSLLVEIRRETNAD
jgi:hypothetical protein